MPHFWWKDLANWFHFSLEDSEDIQSEGDIECSKSLPDLNKKSLQF